MNIYYRKMIIEDLSEVMKIEKEAFSNPWDSKFFQEMIDQHICFVNYTNNELCGYFAGIKYEKVFYLMNFAVKKKYQRQGSGLKLMEYLLNKIEEENYQIVLLDVRKSNEKAINLYKKVGFSIYNNKKDYYQNPNEDAIQMILKI